jgi:hypothetical protein
MTDLQLLQALYEGDDFDSFMHFFKKCYTHANTAERLALLLRFACEWHNAETCDLPNELAKIHLHSIVE